MISRRNIRVKVMQTLYSLATQEESVKVADQVKHLKYQLDQSRQLFVYLIHSVTEIARYSETDARNRASKHLPSAADLAVNTKIAGNELLWKILEHESYKQLVKEERPELLDEPEMLKKLYQELCTTPKYQEYIAAGSREKKTEKDILEYILTDILLPNEAFTNYLEEKYPNWDDDSEMLTQLVLKFLAKPQSYNLNEFLTSEKWDFAKKLLETTLDKEDVAMNYIKPKLKNWDADRIAVLDMILMKMGVCEFLFFETIPPKVTINEYIDLAKEYSTQQSGQFVNGILDNIHKDLANENKLHKVSFKPS
jgi:N utilization substance protein B